MSTLQKPIVVVGSINIDFVVTTDRIPLAGETVPGNDLRTHSGGKGANQAVVAARLGYPVRMIGRVGSDIFGEQMRSGLRSTGVNVDAVCVAEGSTGAAAITVAHTGENSIVVVPGANAAVTPHFVEQHCEAIRSAGIVLTQLEIPLDTLEYLSGMCKRYGIPLMLDPAPASALPVSILQCVTWFTPNETEAAFYAERIDPALAGADPSRMAAAFLRTGVEAVVLKRGAHGVSLATGSGTRHLPAIPVHAVDSTAAGDAFNGAFAVGLMLGMKPIEAARFACAAAAVSVTRTGAQPSMPDRSDVESMLQAYPSIGEE